MTTSRAGRPGRARFVGRRRELEQLYDAMHAAVAEQRMQQALVVGSSGIGKTRLLDELVDLLRGSGRPLAVYQPRLAGGGSPALLAQLLRSRFALDHREGPREQLDRIGAALGSLVPPAQLDDATRLLGTLLELTHDEAGAPLGGFDPQMIRDQRYRARAIKTALNLLRFDTGARPHLLVLDDLDRLARPDDRAVLRALLATLADRPVCVIGAATEAPGLLEPSLRLDLAPLSAAEMTTFVQGLLEDVESLPEQVVATTVGQAQGSPVLAAELVRLLVHREVVIHDGKRWVFAESHFEAKTIPANVGESVRERVQGLPESEQQALALAAAAGDPAHVGAVVSLARAMCPPAEDGLHLDRDPVRLRIEGALMSLVERGVLEQVNSPLLVDQPALRFSSPQIRNEALATLAEADQPRLRLMTAQWLAAARPRDRRRWLMARAGHLEAGGRGFSAGPLLLEAGALARVGHQSDEAERLFTRALAACGAAEAELRAELMARLAELAVERGALDEAEGLILDALHWAAVVDDRLRSGQLHVQLAGVLRARGELERALEHGHHARSLLASEGPVAADAEESIARTLVQQGHKGALAQARKLLETALELRRTASDPAALGSTMTFLANVKYSAGELEAAIRTHQEALSLRERARDTRGQLETLGGLANARYDNGQHDEAITLWERALGLATEIGDRAQHALLQIHLGEAHVEARRLDEANLALRSALSTAEELGLTHLRGCALAALSWKSLEAGQESAALTLANQACEVGYAIDSREVLSQALLAKARALSNALFIDSPEDDRRQQEASDTFRRAMRLLEEMGEKPTLARAAEAFGNFLLERGLTARGQAMIEKAERVRREMRGERSDKVFHEARTIRRQYPTTPLNVGDLEVLLQDTRRKGA